MGLKTPQETFGKLLKDHKCHIVSTCEIAPLNITGIIKDYKLCGNELILIIDMDDKNVKVGMNHPKLRIELLT